MVWNSLENAVADEFASLDSDGKLRFMKQAETKKAYTGESARILDKMKEDPIMHTIEDHPEELYGNYVSTIKCDKCGTERWYTQTTLRSAMYIREMQKHFDLDRVKWLTDFGPGYGGFVRVWNILYPHTDFYQLVDLPRLKQISEYYLRKYDIKTKTHVTLEQHKNPDHHGDKSLFVATHSLNECGLDVRVEVEKILPNYDYIYIVYNRMIEQINNIVYFEQLGEKLQETHNVHMYFEESTSKWRLVAIK